MFQYMVFVGAPTNEVPSYDEHTADGRGVFRIYTEESPDAVEGGVSPFTLNRETFWRKAKVVYCKDEANANEAAKLLATRQPGRIVTISKVIGAAQCPPGNVVLTQVNEKGVLPK